ncbi:hypothetical protein WICPIJ_002281 [Wickerhamomyces pijperi]|uniref:Uncharacterized protein n=1 Tax=Wickerhamomyces pijperi TaxID=599730 RepID=A0A9P8Q9F2_WICPI|nr:hypothetical protein WICPIJ_002281 [Wickerhamomyces pijperi]
MTRTKKKKTSIHKKYDHLISLILNSVAALWNSGQPVEEDSEEPIDEDVGNEDTKVSPLTGVTQADGRQEGIGGGQRTELTVGGGKRVVHITGTSSLDVWSQVITTSQTGSWLHSHQFSGGTFDNLMSKSVGQETINKVGERRDSVHEDPETWQSLRTNQNTTEIQRQGEHQRSQVTSGIGQFKWSDNHMSHRTGVDVEQNSEEPSVGTSLVNQVVESSILVETNWVVEGEEGNGTNKHIPWQFSGDLGKNKGDPGEEHEDGEHLVLQTLHGGLSMEERETQEQRRNNSKEDLSPDVSWSSPVLLEDTLSNKSVLSPETSGEFFMTNRVIWLLDQLSFHVIQLVNHSLSFVRVQPNFMIILVGMRTRSSTDNVSWFIQEQQQLWLGGQFNTNGQSLSLFNVQTFTSNTNNGVSVLFHFQDLDNFLDVGILLFVGHFLWLSQVGRELQGFTDSGSGQVEILLLNITGRSLERGVSQTTVDEHITSNNTHGNTVGQDVQQRSLTGTRCTHKGSQGTWFNPTINTVQNSTLFLLDLDSVTDISPVEDIGPTLQSRNLRTVSRGFFLGSDILLVATRFQIVDNRLVLVVFGKHHVDSQQEEDETQKNTKVSPLVSVGVFVGLFQVDRTGDIGLTWDSTDSGTDIVSVTRSNTIWCSRNVIRTVVVDTRELVSQQGFKGIGQWVDVVDPSTPRQHVVHRNDETNKNNQSQQQEMGRSDSLSQRGRSRTCQTEKMGHGESSSKVDHQVEEESTWFSSEVHHEVVDQVEEQRGHNLERNLGHNGGKSIGGRMVQRVLLVLLNNRSSFEQSHNFQERKEPIEQDSKEHGGTSRVERMGVTLHVVEDGRQDQSHQRVGKNGEHSEPHVVVDSLVLSDNQVLSLHEEGDSVWGGLSHVLGLLSIVG